MFYSSQSLLESVGSAKKESESVHSEKEENNNFVLASTIPDASPVKKEGSNPNTPVSKHEIKKDSGQKTKGQLQLDDSSKFAVGSDDESVNGIVMEVPSETPSSSPRSKTLDFMKLLNPSNLLSSYNLLLESFYEEHRHELVQPTKLVMRVITWNLNQMKPPSLKTLAGEDGREWASFFYAGDSTVNEGNPNGLADIYCINFQETISLRSFSKNTSAIEDWVTFLLSVLNAISIHHYQVVHKTGLLALTSIVLAKETLNEDKLHGFNGQIHDIKEDSLGLGYLRWANKGCISVQFTIGGINLGLTKGSKTHSHISKGDDLGYHFDELDGTASKIPGIEVQLLNVHLVHGEDQQQVQQRWDSWAKIERKIGLNDRTVKLAYDPITGELKTSARKRLETRLREKLKKDKSRNRNKEGSPNLETELKALSISDDSVRESHIPMHFAKIEEQKFQGVVTPIDILKITKLIEASKSVVVCGDTNYRLDLENNSSNQGAIHEYVSKGLWNKIYKDDQLRKEMLAKRVFVGFEELPVKFAPTFKILNNSYGKWAYQEVPQTSHQSSSDDVSNKRQRKPVPVEHLKMESPYYIPRYDGKRLPAYTDRIVYTNRPYFRNLDQSYSSIAIRGSDHLPVAASYVIDAPLVQQSKLNAIKGQFNNVWDSIINTLQFLGVTNKITIIHGITSRFANSELESMKGQVIETLPLKAGHIKFAAMAGETISIKIGIQNIVDESFELVIKEQSGREWFGTKIDIDCKEIKEGETTTQNDKSSNSVSTIGSHRMGEIILTFKQSSPGKLERTFIAEIPEYSLCPAYRKFFALSVDIKDIFGVSLDEITESEFSNIKNCFEFVFHNSTTGVLERMEAISSIDDFNDFEWILVREVTLWGFESEKYSNLNGTLSPKENLGTVTVMSFLYTWLKSQTGNLRANSSRSKMTFTYVIKLIKFFQLDAEQGYNLFGWLFADEYELADYLEQDSDIKVNL